MAARGVLSLEAAEYEWNSELPVTDDAHSGRLRKRKELQAALEVRPVVAVWWRSFAAQRSLPPGPPPAQVARARAQKAQLAAAGLVSHHAGAPPHSRTKTAVRRTTQPSGRGHSQSVRRTLCRRSRRRQQSQSVQSQPVAASVQTATRGMAAPHSY